MRPTSPIFQIPSVSPSLLEKINWLRASGRYVVIDPSDDTSLLYLSEREYNKLVINSIAQDRTIVKIASPDDNAESIKAKFKPDSSTPNFSFLLSRLHRLVSIIPGWKIKDSMIEFEGNFEHFIPYYYNDIITWLGVPSSVNHRKAIRKLSWNLTQYFSFRGINQTILVMKITSIVILKYLAGEKLTTTQPLGQRIKLVNGLPKLLPHFIRLQIRQNHTNFIRVYMTLFYAYKAMKGKWGDPDISSIESQPFYLPESLEEELYSQRYWFWRDFFGGPTKMTVPALKEVSLPLILKAGPNSNPSVGGLVADAIWHANHPRQTLKRFSELLWKEYKIRPSSWTYMDNTYYDLTRAIKSGKATFGSVFSGMEPLLRFIKRKDPLWRECSKDSLFTMDHLTHLVQYVRGGKLAVKLEAAGKVRVFAILDYFTQYALRPIHEDMLSCLRRHESDATYDQIGKVKETLSKRYRTAFSFDLKSATDLIPRQIYKIMLGHRYTDEISHAWCDLLVDREFFFGKRTKTHPKDSLFTYTRGQPMGALSSWPALALAHHFLVFLAATRLGRDYRNFREYLVLGDDLVIFDGAVAHSYLSVCQDYGITVGLPKSFVSAEGLYQFASQDVLMGQIISPIPLKDALSASFASNLLNRFSLFDKRIEFGRRIIEKLEYSENTMIAFARTQCTSYQWRVNKNIFLRGVIPPEIRDILFIKLLQDFKSSKNLLALDRVIAASAGHYSLFAQGDKLSLDPALRLTFLINFFDRMILDMSIKVGKLSKVFESRDKVFVSPYSSISSFVWSGILRQLIYRADEDFMEIKEEFFQLAPRIENLLHYPEASFGNLETDKDLFLAYTYFERIMDLHNKINGFNLQFSLKRRIISRIRNGKPSYFLRFQLFSICNEEIKKGLKWS